MASEQEAGSAVGVDDPQQQQAIAEEETTLATTLEGGGSWYWTNMLNFSQSGSSSSYTSAGQMAGSQITTGSPPSFSSVHNNNNAMNSGNNRNTSNNQVIHGPTPLDSVLPCSNNNASNSDPENAVWGQDFLSGPICDSKASMPECSADDGLQELLYPRSVRELLLDVQSPSWDLLQQAAINKSFGFPLATDDQLAPAQLHGLLANADVKPTHVMQSGLHFPHDDRQSCSTASTTEPQLWPITQAAGTDHAAQADARACAMHVPRATFLQHQFDHTRVKQEYAQQLSSNCCASSSSAFAKASGINPFLLQHQQQQQQHRLRLMSPTHDPAGLHLNEAAMANMNSDVKPSKQELHSWPSSPAAIATSMHLCRSSSSTFDLAGGQVHSPAGAAPAVDPHHFLLNSFQSQGHQHVENPGFPANHDAPFFQALDHHQLLQQAGLQGHLHRHPPGSVVNNQPIQYLNQQGGGLKKSRAHLEEPGKDMKGVAGSPDDFGLKRPKLESQQQQQTASGSFKGQPARKEKLGDRITTLQQLVSPYGKTDTASVLLEAIGCIKFLQDQVQTLSSPYLKSTSNPTSQNGDNNQNGEESKPDLRSKGLCLVPISCTMQVANDNGTDYWYGGAFR